MVSEAGDHGPTGGPPQMRKVAVITDSTCCLPADLVVRHAIHVVPLQIVIEGRAYRDGLDIVPGEVYQIMRRGGSLPTTSSPTPDDFLQAYLEAGREAESIVCITLTGLQSKTWEAAALGRRVAGDLMPRTPIEVIDSRAVSGALGLIALEAARAADRGAGLEEVGQAARRAGAGVNFLAMLDTLRFLARTGRIARAAAWAGSVLNVKPIVEHSTAVGETTPFARPRSRAKAVDLMLQTMAERMGGSPVHVLVHHADELREGEKLMAEIERRFRCSEIYLTEFTPIMGAHAGPGVLAVAFRKVG